MFAGYVIFALLGKAEEQKKKTPVISGGQGEAFESVIHPLSPLSLVCRPVTISRVFFFSVHGCILVASCQRAFILRKVCNTLRIYTLS